MTPEGELVARIRGLQWAMAAAEIDAALIVQNTDLYYYAGTVQQAHLLVPAKGEPELLVRRDLARARRESALGSVVPLLSLKGLAARIGDLGLRRGFRLGMELDVLPALLYLRYRELLPSAEIVDLSELIKAQRAVKSPYELGLMRETARLMERLVAWVGEHLKEGVSEVELAAEAEAAARKMGHQGLIRMRRFNQEMFYGHLVAGPSAAEPTFLDTPIGGPGPNPCIAQGAGQRPIGRHEPVMFDFVGAREGYLIDQTRIFSLGVLPDRFLRAYEVSRAIQAEAVKQSVPGIKWCSLYELAQEMAEEAGLLDHLGGYREGRVGFVGHGVGLELDELPFIARGQEQTLKAGMTFALEPKFVFPGEGAIGIENTFLVTDSGLEKLSDWPEEIVVL